LQSVSKTGCAILSILESFCIGFLGYYLLYSPKLPGKTGFAEIFVFSVLFYLFLIKKGGFSKLFENNLSVFLGRFSYSIYCIHPLMLAIFKSAIINKHQALFTTYQTLGYFLLIAVIVIVGVVLYYVFEKPVNKLLLPKILRYFEDNKVNGGGI
jgi:peptidoglycan/LPS O-acetylase OafA/YrhL